MADIKLIALDMDGTLVDSMGYWQSLEREFLVSKGVTENLEDILEADRLARASVRNQINIK